MSRSRVKIAVDADQSAELSCRARGWPKPSMTWSTNSTLSAGFSNQSVTGSYDADEQFPVESMLNISSVQLHDLGIYTCTAQNNMSVNVTHFHLTVKSKPLLSSQLFVVKDVYTVSQKTTLLLAITSTYIIIFDRYVAKKVSSETLLYFPISPN